MSTAAPVTTTKQDTTGWIAEWTRDPTPCRDACADALTMFSLDLVGIVVRLLRKHDLFGKAELEEAYGKTRLEEQVGFVHELPLPDNIDVILQTDLSALFSEKARACWAGKQKVTEVFSLYFRPENLSELDALKLAGLTCTGTHEWATGIDTSARWMLFPDECTGLNRRFGSQSSAEYIPAGFDGARIFEAIFCISTKYASTKERIYANKSLRCFVVRDVYLVVSFEEGGLAVTKRIEYGGHRITNEREGIAPIMKFEGPHKA